MAFSVGVTINDKQLQRKFANLPKLSQDKLWDEIRKATIETHSNAVKAIQKVSVGERQTRYRPRRNVVVSRPGDAPNTDTGRLISSVAFDLSRARMIGRVGTNVKYGLFLELGTFDIKARPWLRPAFRKALAAYRKRIKGLKLGV